MVDALGNPDVYLWNPGHQPASGLFDWNCHRACLVNFVRRNFTFDLCLPISQRRRIPLAGTSRAGLWDRGSLYADEPAPGCALPNPGPGGVSSFRRNFGDSTLLWYPPGSLLRMGSVRRYHYADSGDLNLGALAIEFRLGNRNFSGNQPNL